MSIVSIIFFEYTLFNPFMKISNLSEGLQYLPFDVILLAAILRRLRVEDGCGLFVRIPVWWQGLRGSTRKFLVCKIFGLRFLRFIKYFEKSPQFFYS